MPSRNSTPSAPPPKIEAPNARTEELQKEDPTLKSATYLTDLVEEEEECSKTQDILEVTSSDLPSSTSKKVPSQCSSAKLRRLPPPEVSSKYAIQNSDSHAPSATSSSTLSSSSESQKDQKGSENGGSIGDNEDARRDRIVLGLEGEENDDEDNEDRDSVVDIINVDISQEENYDTDLDMDDDEWLNPPIEFDVSGVKSYIRECNRLGVIPISYFQRHIEDRRFVMRNHGLGPLGAKAIAKPLENNSIIEVLDLEGNEICGEGAQHLCKMLKDNIYITELGLSENSLGSQGCAAICDMLQDNVVIADVDIGGNNFSDNDCHNFRHMLEKNNTLKRLTLRHNNFEEEGLKHFKEALQSNENLKYLDLSWNHIRLKGAIYVADLIKENYGLKTLNLAMNGFGDPGAAAVGASLRVNQCLSELNISSNRITQAGALDIARGLLTNDCLTILRMGMNSIGEDGAMALLSAIDRNENSALTLLDLTNVIVTQEFEDLKEKINNERAPKLLVVIHGGVYFGNKQSEAMEYDPELEFENDPMTKLKNYAAKAKLRLVDLFRFFDRDQSWSVDREEFLAGVKVSQERILHIKDAKTCRILVKKATGIDMTEKDVDVLIKRLDKDGDGEIDYGELSQGDMQHREAKREVLQYKEEKAQIEKKKGESKNKDELGQLL